MKSYNHLFEKLIDPENLEKAIMRSSTRKRHRATVKEVLENKEKCIKELQEALINQTLKIRKHQAIEIYDGVSKKKRLIIQPDYKFEQILHHAVVQVMQPIFYKGMYEYSCGSIPNRGAHFGKKYIERFIRKNKSEIKYVLKLDIKRYYQSIDTELLKEKLREIIHDEKMMYVLELILDSNVAVHNGEHIKVGVPIGFYTSQWLANWFLQGLDHFIKEQLHVKCYVRYIDDMVLFGKNKKELHRNFLEIQKYLKNLNLEVKSNYQVFRFDYKAFDGKQKGRPIDFMGFKFWRNRTTLRRSILLKATRKARKIKKKKKYTWYDASQLLSYTGWFKCTDTHGAFLKYISSCVDIKACKQQVSRRQQQINKEAQNGIKLETNRKQGTAA